MGKKLMAVVAAVVGAGAVVGGYVAYGAWFTGDAGPSPSATASPSATSPAGEPLQGFVPRGVTSARFLPRAAPLNAQALQSVVPGGAVLALFDSTRLAPGADAVPGVRVLYLATLGGEAYEVVNATELGWDNPQLVAWDAQRHLALVSEDRNTLHVLSLVTGAVEHTWEVCGEGTVLRGMATSGAWVVRGSCEGEPIDGLYSDTGELLPSAYGGKEWGTVTYDVGDIQVSHAFESLIEERFVATYPDGSSAPLAIAGSGDCYPIGAAGDAAIAAFCYSDEGVLSVWEIPVDGGAPTETISAGDIDVAQSFTLFDSSAGAAVTRYCRDGEVPAAVVESFDADRSVPQLVRFADAIEPYVRPGATVDDCHAALGDGLVASGDGRLWWFSPEGVAVDLLPLAADDPLDIVGVDGSTVLLAQ